MTEPFFSSWYELNIFEIYSFSEDVFKNEIINQVKNIKHFGKWKNLAVVQNVRS